jgi:hypothetical protein
MIEDEIEKKLLMANSIEPNQKKVTKQKLKRKRIKPKKITG